MVNLDKKIKELFDEVVANADAFKTYNRYLFGDIENVIPYNTRGSRIYDIVLSSKFDNLFSQLLETKTTHLLGMREAAWELRKQPQNGTYNGKNVASYDFIQAVVRYKSNSEDK